MVKHEIIGCDRCGARIECKANSFTKCQCSEVQLTLNELEYIGDQYEACLCAGCLSILQQEYQGNLATVAYK
ncbi:cysteine-rich CWC family protein [Mucilaginibacter arboris]|uniref:Cysteine-rich CWC n=1 Tax=Mucilaginibacter arboris TaxID=2682090 RepID=A0A7K1T1W8_9SPHI|nr:cysteine-rich CWC family protein [Mucilaginibacter arboris]MVN23290.1 hypothetical protein [Mucilaginibacter arboris]